VGSLDGVGGSVFGEMFDYVALGHLHVPQTVGGNEYIRYSGSPLAMGFGEAGQQKSACMVDFEGKTPRFSLLDIPAFRNMANIRGDKKEIESQLIPLVKSPDDIYIAVTYTGEEKIDNVMWLVNELLEKLYTLYRTDGHHNIYCLNTQIVRPNSQNECANPTEISNESLEDFNETEVFERLLDANKIDESERNGLLECYRELLVKVNQHS
jgi:exonuclease SbcD